MSAVVETYLRENFNPETSIIGLETKVMSGP